MRRLFSLAVAAIVIGLGAGFAIGADAPAGAPGQPKARSDWPTEKVLVIGRRGNLRSAIVDADIFIGQEPRQLEQTLHVEKRMIAQLVMHPASPRVELGQQVGTVKHQMTGGGRRDERHG